MSGIVRHVCIDLLRRGANRPPFGPELDAVEEAEALHASVAVDIERCLRRLDAVESKAIRMAFHFGLTHAEPAKAFRVPLGTMKSTIRKALAKLKECLDPGDTNA
jgi:RNA polymerase sigma-70 factor (ECF subfamily)